VAGIVTVLAEADELEARFDQVLALLPGEVVGIGDLVIYRAADGCGQADVREAIAEHNRTQAGIRLAAADAELGVAIRAQLPAPSDGHAVVNAHSRIANAGLVHDGRQKGARPSHYRAHGRDHVRSSHDHGHFFLATELFVPADRPPHHDGV